MKKQDHELLQRLLDGQMDAVEFAQVQERLRQEPELRRLYRDYALLSHSLSEELEGGFPVEGSRGWLRMRRMLVVLAMLAVLLAVPAGAWLWAWWGGNRRPDVAVITFSVDAVRRMEGRHRIIGGATGVAAGTVTRLELGRAMVSLEPSVFGVFEGPSEWSVDGAGVVGLHEGRVFFQCTGSGSDLTVDAGILKVSATASSFGVEAIGGGSAELHVMEGHLTARVKSGDPLALRSGQAVRVDPTGAIQRIPLDGLRFKDALGRFRSVVADGGTGWKVARGNPAIRGDTIEGENFAAWLDLPKPIPGDRESVVLVGFSAGAGEGGKFHTEGWAGVSLFAGDQEVIFAGDAFGVAPVWAIDLRQGPSIVNAGPEMVGERQVTLRYDMRTGEVTLHDGTVPLGHPVCRGRIAPGLAIDRIRVGASAGATMRLSGLVVRSGG